ncbi:enhancer of yellow 2 transcription factor-like protein [Nannochloropsis gaditana CCMP526]|uniref:enhancer of yellow 2 transcription factor-like protein n=1 Tax=Nannochloropsis gaditana (strain CCMP526) TaxID=1093141 RepID=UPI00029F6BD9|nr:enhancer of yellow 2 transcription factor-like protein [Nannochloropsis gaditana CCMP526]EKU21198.1 enhancer of yellow 2 transcription factor-like protein [Nannochloropsis gaditana CCMP526]|eukprot:XP_005855157.1 enhancer of yellow 2 transcription factor-like protein [Nannochloropsis gaditana CCMP526]
MMTEEREQLERQDAADQQQQMAILQQLIESGEKDRIKALLRERLQEWGWQDQVKEFCKEVMRIKGTESVTLDELVEQVLSKARAAVPDSVKVEALKEVRAFLETGND